MMISWMALCVNCFFEIFLHALSGVKVQKVQRVLRVQRVSEGGGLPLCGNAYKVSVTGFTFSVIWHDKHSADWLAALATPYPGCAGLPPIQGAE